VSGKGRILAKSQREGAAHPGARLRIALVVFVLALMVRSVYLVELSGSDFFCYRGLDAQNYHARALGFVEGTWPRKQAFFWPPLYSLFLGILYKTAGQGIALVKGIQAVLGSLSCVLVYMIALRTFQRRPTAIWASAPGVQHGDKLLPG